VEVVDEGDFADHREDDARRIETVGLGGQRLAENPEKKNERRERRRSYALNPPECHE
jgi:hypothetical protein